MSSTPSNTPSTAPGHRSWAWRAPGAVFYGIIAFAAIEGLWVSIRSKAGLGFTVVLWVSVAGIWIARLAGAALLTRLRLSLAEWVRWLVVPVVLGIVFLAAQTSLPFDVRLSLSRCR